MEELRSTEILDREIQEDARRKAEKILKSVEAECALIAAGVVSRVGETRRQKEAEYAKRAEAYRRDAESTLPLEKERARVSFIDSGVNGALNSWFEQIGPDRRLALYAGLLEKYRPALAGKKLRASCAGYPADEVRLLVERVFGKDSIDSVAEISPAALLAARFSDGILIEASDRSVLCRATREELRSVLLSEQRQELAEALLGGRLPE